MNTLESIQAPVQADLQEFRRQFSDTLQSDNPLLHAALDHILNRCGKMVRPTMVMLAARSVGEVNQRVMDVALALELLHTASLVHDDVVDESEERRGQASVNATYDNKVAVLVGDYLLSTALLHVAYTQNTEIVRYLAELGRTLASGEILQLSNISNEKISEDVYYQVISQKTAALFEACCAIGALSAGASPEEIEKAKQYGRNLGIIFQIRDDIFDYYESKEIGKPTGNDMAEGKLTLPVIHALNSTGDGRMMQLAYKVKARTATADEIASLVAFAKENGGIDYAEKRMWDFHRLATDFIRSEVRLPELKESLSAYLDFVIQRDN